MMRAGAFDQLLGLAPPANLPKATRASVMVNGREITSLLQLPADERTPRIRRELARAKARAKYQRDRQNPAKMAARQAWLDANREQVREWKRGYDQRTKEHQRQVKADWAKRNYHAQPDAMRARSRAWYADNREAVLAQKKAQRDAAAAAKKGGAL